MSAITVAALVAAGVAPTQARAFADPLAAACALYDISTPARIAGLVAQCRVESANFTRLEEGLYYTSPMRVMDVFGRRRVPDLETAARLCRNPRALASRVYANMLGNRDEASGDGWRYRGRGLIQLTGRANYTDAAVETGRPYIDQPQLVGEPSDACLTAAWFWHTRKCNILADSAQWGAITREVNGPAMLHLAERVQYSEDGLRAFA